MATAMRKGRTGDAGQQWENRVLQGTQGSRGNIRSQREQKAIEGTEYRRIGQRAIDATSVYGCRGGRWLEETEGRREDREQ